MAGGWQPLVPDEVCPPFDFPKVSPLKRGKPYRWVQLTVTETEHSCWRRPCVLELASCVLGHRCAVSPSPSLAGMCGAPAACGPPLPTTRWASGTPRQGQSRCSGSLGEQRAAKQARRWLVGWRAGRRSLLRSHACTSAAPQYSCTPFHPLSNTQIWNEPGGLVGEPIFVPAPDAAAGEPSAAGVGSAGTKRWRHVCMEWTAPLSLPLGLPPPPDPILCVLQRTTAWCWLWWWKKVATAAWCAWMAPRCRSRRAPACPGALPSASMAALCQRPDTCALSALDATRIHDICSLYCLHPLLVCTLIYAQQANACGTALAFSPVLLPSSRPACCLFSRLPCW